MEGLAIRHRASLVFPEVVQIESIYLFWRQNWGGVLIFVAKFSSLEYELENFDKYGKKISHSAVKKETEI